MTYILEEIVKNKDVTIKTLRYPDLDLSEVDLAIFNTQEQNEFNSFKSRKRQLEYYYARVLWMSFNQKEFIKYKSSGKPILNIGYISISHSHKQVAIALSLTKEVGMDLELESEKVRTIKSKYLHPTENYSSIKDLTKIWTIKEAIYKLYDSKLLFFKEHITVYKLGTTAEISVTLHTKNINPTVITIELDNKFLLSYAQ